MPADNVIPFVLTVDPEVQVIFDHWVAKGDHAEIKRFEELIGPTVGVGANGIMRQLNVWDFIKDAIEGTGGFADGSYLVPHKREFDRGKQTLVAKFWERAVLADYDNFPRTIAETPINFIVEAKDLIQRETDDPRLERWWTNIDGEGTNIEDFLLGFPAAQAQAYGTAWIFVDRPGGIGNLAEDVQPGNEVYIRCVATRNVVYWEFDEDGAFSALVVREPETDVSGDACPVRVWTADAWGLFEPDAVAPTSSGATKQGKTSYHPTAGGDNQLGRIPVAQLHYEDPAPKRALGKSPMLDVARVARTVYNMESEAREIERKCAFAMLAVPRKTLGGRTKVEVGTDSLFEYDGEGGEPKWIEPSLNSLDKYRERIKEKRESAFSMAHMAAVSGYVQTSSGFHTEAEFAKTGRRIGKFAAQLETVEAQIGSLYLQYHGVNPARAVGMVNVSYPRDFGLKDVAALVDRTQKRLDMTGGEEDAFMAFRDLYQGLYPRKSAAELEALARKAAQSRTADAARTTAERVKAIVARGQQGATQKTIPPSQGGGAMAMAKGA